MFDSEFKSSHKEMIEKIWALVDEADAVCHYNGTKFDMPTLNKEFLLYDLPPPTPYQEIDLLKTARRKFRLASNKLDYVAQFLGLGSKVKHMGMDLWTRCMEGDPSAWKIMEKYNKQDVVLLEKVYTRLLAWIDGHPNMALYVDDLISPTCPKCGSTKVKRNGEGRKGLSIYTRFYCNNCKSSLRGPNLPIESEKRKMVLR